MNPKAVEPGIPGLKIDPRTISIVSQLKLTNAEFIAAVFSDVPEDAMPVVTAKSGDPQVGGWIAHPAKDVDRVCLQDRNSYVNCASFRLGEDGALAARKDHAAAYHALVLDDVGTKVSRSLLTNVASTWELETSPGNFQIGFKLSPPLTDPAEVDRLQQKISGAGLTDKGAMGMARWVRLPNGINGKPKYTSNGKLFSCRLHRWKPEVSYSATELAAALAPNAISSAKTPERVDMPIRFSGSADISTVIKLLDKIDPDCGYADWLSVLMAVFHETGGSSEGLNLADQWSRKGSSYKGRAEIELKWRSFEGSVARPVTLGTLIAKAKASGADIAEIIGDQFKPCKTEVIEPADTIPVSTPPKKSPFDRFSLRGLATKYEQLAEEAKPLLGDVCLSGEATVWYARHNVGKTLLTMHLLTEAIEQGRIVGTNCYYVNADDSSSGLAMKLGILDELGAHTLVPGQAGFKAEELEGLLMAAAQNGSARGTLIIVDTIKKFADLMNKASGARFANACRQFVSAGGTVLGLAHINKRRGEDGKAIPAGTSDILDDFDAGYIIDEFAQGDPSDEKVVEFARLKSRGGGVESAGFAYSAEEGVSYPQRLASVRRVSLEDLHGFKEEVAKRSDADVIAVVRTAILGGVTAKMALSKEVAASAGISRRAAMAVIERYTGNDPAQHHWAFEVKARGAKLFRLLSGDPG